MLFFLYCSKSMLLGGLYMDEARNWRDDCGWPNGQEDTVHGNKLKAVKHLATKLGLDTSHLGLDA